MNATTINHRVILPKGIGLKALQTAPTGGGVGFTGGELMSSVIVKMCHTAIRSGDVGFLLSIIIRTAGGTHRITMHDHVTSGIVKPSLLFLTGDGMHHFIKNIFLDRLLLITATHGGDQTGVIKSSLITDGIGVCGEAIPRIIGPAFSVL